MVIIYSVLQNAKEDFNCLPLDDILPPLLLDTSCEIGISIEYQCYMDKEGGL